jgi:hypothetical protein
VGKDVWLGASVCVTDGVRIGDHARWRRARGTRPPRRPVRASARAATGGSR